MLIFVGFVAVYQRVTRGYYPAKWGQSNGFTTHCAATANGLWPMAVTRPAVFECTVSIKNWMMYVISKHNDVYFMHRFQEKNDTHLKGMTELRCTHMDMIVLYVHLFQKQIQLGTCTIILK